MNEGIDIPEGFKMTEIGPLPEEWEIEKLGEVAEVIMGQSPPGKTYNKMGEGTPFLQGKAEFGTISPKNVKYTTKPLKIGSRGSVLISVRAPVGDVNVANIDYCIGRGLASLSLYKGENFFLFFLLSFFKNEIEREGFGSTFKAISKSKLQDFKIPLPPLPEQKQIAFVLSTIQQTIEKTEAVINATKELKKSMMNHLFTYGPVSVDEAEDVVLKETEIGLIPEEWEVVRLGEVLSLRKESIKPENANGVIYVGLEHINSGELKIKEFGKPIDVKSTKNVFYEGDILYGKLRPYLDKIAVSHRKGICSTDILVLKASPEKTIVQYLANFMHTKPFLDYAIMTMSGVNHPRTSWSKLEAFKIPLPPYFGQKQITNILSIIDQKIETEKTRKKALEELFRTLLQNLMKGKIRVTHLEVSYDRTR